MLYVILLLILAVLLFGSSAVLGAIGRVLGLIVALVALVWLSVALGINMITVLIVGFFGFLVLCGLVVLSAKMIQPWEVKRIQARFEAEAAERRSKGVESRGDAEIRIVAEATSQAIRESGEQWASLSKTERDSKIVDIIVRKKIAGS